MGSSPEDKRRRARKRRRSEVNEKKIALIKTFRKLQNAIEDLAHTAMSRKRSHSSSSSSTSDSSATSSFSSSASSTSATSTSGSSTSTSSSSEEENRRHRRVSERSRSRSRLRRYRKNKDGRSRSSRSKSNRKSRSRDAKCKTDDKKSAKDPRKRLKIDDLHETAKNTLQDSRDDSESVKSQSEPRTSGLAVKILSDNIKIHRSDSKSRSGSKERKKNREKDDKKSDDGERNLDCRQDTEVGKKDSRVKCKHSSKNDMDGSAMASDDRIDKQIEASRSTVKICSDDKKTYRGDLKNRSRSRERKKNREKDDTKSDDGERVLECRQDSEVAKKDSRVESKRSHRNDIDGSAMISDDRNDKQNEASRSAVKICSDEKKTYRSDSKSRSRSRERKKNREKDDTKSDDGERNSDCRQDPEVVKKDSQVKSKHSRKNDVDGSAMVSDDRIDKQNEASRSAVKICSDDKKIYRSDLNSRSGSRERKKNREKDDRKSDDGERNLDCRQDSEVAKKDSRVKSKHSRKNDIDGSAIASVVQNVDSQSVIDDRKDKQNETSGMAVKTCSDDKKTYRNDSKSRSRSRERKKNREKNYTKSDDGERNLDCRQDSEVVKKDSRVKSTHSRKNDIDGSAIASVVHNVDGQLAIDDRNYEQNKASGMAVKNCSDHKNTDSDNLNIPNRREKTKKNNEKDDTKHDDRENLASRHQKIEIVSPSSQDKEKNTHKTDINSSQSLMMSLNIDGQPVIIDTRKKPTKSADKNDDTEEKKAQKISNEKAVKKDDDAQAAVVDRDNDDREKSQTNKKSKDILQDSESTTEIISTSQIESSSLAASIHVVDGRSSKLNDNETIIVSEGSNENKSENNIPKKSEDHTVNIVDISEAVDSVDCKDDDHVESTLQEVVDKVLESLHKKDQYCGAKLALLDEETEENIQVVKNDAKLFSNDSHNVLTITDAKNKAETILKKGVDNGENGENILQKKEEAVNKDAMLPDEEIVGKNIDLQNRNAQRSSVENESSDESDLLQDLLSWFPAEDFCDTDDDNDNATNERRNLDGKILEVVDAEVDEKDQKTEMTTEENDALMTHEEILTDKEINIVFPSSEKSQTCKFDDDKEAKTKAIEEDEYRSEVVKKNDDIFLKDNPISNENDKADEAEEFVLEFVDDDATTEQQKSAEVQNVELPKSLSETKMPKNPPEESVVSKKCDDAKDKIEKEENLEETSIQEKNEAEKSKKVNSAEMDNCKESEIPEMHLEEFSDLLVNKEKAKNQDKVEENQSKNVGNSLQENEQPMVIEESSSQDDEEEAEDSSESENSGNDAPEEKIEEPKKMSENLTNKTQEKLPTLGLQSLLYNMCRFLSSSVVKDNLASSKPAAEVETHAKSDFSSEDVPKNGSSCKEEEKIVPEEIATTSGLQIVSSDHEMTEKNAPNSEESISQPKLLGESAKKSSMLSAVTAILETAVKPFDGTENKYSKEKEPTANPKSSKESMEEFSSQESENCAEKEPIKVAKSSAGVEKELSQENMLSAVTAILETAVKPLDATKNEDSKEKEPSANPKSSEESMEEFSTQETEICAENEPITVAKSSADVEEELSQETENFAEKETQIVPELSTDFSVRESTNMTEKVPPTSEFSAESAEKFGLHRIENLTEREFTNVAEKVPPTSEFPAESAEKFGPHKIENSTEKESLLSLEFSAESSEKLALQETGNDLEKETLVATKLAEESADKLASETGNLDEKEPAMPSEMPTKSVEEFSTEENHHAEEKTPIFSKLLAESMEELASQETEKTVDKNPPIAPLLPATSANEFLPLGIKDFAEIEFMEVEVSNSVTEATENTSLYKMEQKIEENVPAANSTVEIATSDHQKDAEDAQEVENKKAEQIIEGNVPAENSTVENTTSDHQKDAEDTQEVKNEKAKQKIVENVPAANSTVEIATSDYQEVENKKAEQKIEENVPEATSVVEITTFDHQEDSEDTQQVNYKKAEHIIEENLPAANSIVEITTTHYQENSEDTQEGKNQKAEQIIEDNLPTANSTVEITTSDLEEGAEKRDSDQKSPRNSANPMLSAVDEILTSALKKFSAVRRSDLTEALEGLTSQNLAMTPKSPSESSGDIISSDTEDFAAEELLMSPEFSEESMGEFPSQEIEDSNEKVSTEASEIFAKSPEDFPTDKIEVFTEKVSTIDPEILSKSMEEFPPQEIEVSAEKVSTMASEILAKSSEDFPTKEIEVFTEKVSSIIPEIPSKSSEDFPPQEMEVSTEKEPMMSTESIKELAHQEFSSKLSEESSSREIVNFAEKETPVAPNLPAESTREFSLHETEKTAEKELLMVPKISTASQEEFFSQETEKELSMAPKLLNESQEESSVHDVNNLIEKEAFENEDFAESSVQVSSQKNSNLAEKEPLMFHKFLTEAAEGTSSQEIENSAEIDVPMDPKFFADPAQELSSQKTKNYFENQPSTVLKFPAEYSAEFSSQQTGSPAEKEESVTLKLSGESSEEFSLQQTGSPVEKEASVTLKLSGESSEEFSSQQTGSPAEKEASVALKLSGESSEEFSSQQTGSAAEKEASVTLKLSRESSEEFSSQQTGSPAEKEASVALKLSRESSEEFSLQQTGSPAEKEASLALKLSGESSEEFSSQQTGSPAEKEASVALKLSGESSEEFFSQETKSPAEKAPQMSPEFPAETSQEVHSQVIEISGEKESPLAREFSEESSQQFYLQETGSVGGKNSPVAAEFPAEPSQEFSLQETGSAAEKQRSVTSKLSGEFSAEFFSQETKSFDEKELPVASAFPGEFSQQLSSPETPFPVQLTQESSPQKIENLAHKEGQISLELSMKSSQDLSSPNAENLPEVTPMEIDSPEISDTENISSDSSLEIISKVEAEREDYESFIYILKRENFTISGNSNLQDENAKVLQNPKNILPLITNIIKNNPKEINLGSTNEISDAEKSRDIRNRSRPEIVDKYRALPSSRNVVCKLRKNLTRSLSSPIDPRILQNSAVNSAGNLEIGSAIDSSLANDWTTIMRRGLSRETKEQLMAKHRPAENCPALKTPLLNASLRHYMDPSILRKDRQLVSSQNQLAAAISAVGKVLSIIEKENVAPEAMQTLGEAGKILADLHHENFVARRSNLTPEIGNYMDNVVGKSAVDHLLFTGNDPENIRENRASTSGREIEMQNSEEKSQKVLRFNNKSAESKSDDESDQEFLASLSGLSDIASLISNDGSADEKSDADFFELLSSDNEDGERKSSREEICKSKSGSEDSEEKTQPEVTGIRKTLFSSNDVEKSGKAFAVEGNNEKIVPAAPKETEIQPLVARHDPEAQKSNTTDSRSVTISKKEKTDLEQKSTAEKICIPQSGSENSPEIIFAGKPRSEVTEAIKTSISSKEAEKSAENFDADKSVKKIVSLKLKTTKIPSSTASNISAEIKSQPSTSGMIKPLILSNEAEKSVEILTERETSENQFLEPKILPVETLKRIFNEKRSPIGLPIFLQGNRLKKKPEHSDSPRSSRIVIKSDTFVKPPQKLSIVSGFPPKSVSFASPTIPPQGQQRQATPWKSKSVRSFGIIDPSLLQNKKQIPEAWGTVKVQAKGAGYAILQMTVQYNVDIKKYQTPPPVKAFDLVVRPHFYGRNQSHITYFSCQRWINTNESSRSGMAVLDVTIPTGYIIQQQNLDRYIRSRQVRNLQRARFQDRKVLFYFDYLDQEETCVNFTVERWFPVANMSRYLPVRVYDYYSPERFNETIFDALATYLLNICEVCGSSQCPYCHIYNAASLIVPPTSFVLLLSVFTATARYFRTQEFSVG